MFYVTSRHTHTCTHTHTHTHAHTQTTHLSVIACCTQSPPCQRKKLGERRIPMGLERHHTVAAGLLLGGGGGEGGGGGLAAPEREGKEMRKSCLSLFFSCHSCSFSSPSGDFQQQQQQRRRQRRQQPLQGPPALEHREPGAQSLPFLQRALLVPRLRSQQQQSLPNGRTRAFLPAPKLATAAAAAAAAKRTGWTCARARTRSRTSERGRERERERERERLCVTAAAAVDD